ncbi:MAG: zinc ribbon domain-containing protein [Terracidiphilus sp.]
MYCSQCGQELIPGQGFCPRCGAPAASPLPPVPGMEIQLRNYASRVRALATFWFLYAGLSLLLGVAALAFANAFFAGRFGPWMGVPMQPMWFGPAILHFAWAILLVRTALAVAAGWGLLERTQWGRTVAILAAFLSLIKFPFGTALGIWTLVVLLGCRNAALYERL